MHAAQLCLSDGDLGCFLSDGSDDDTAHIGDNALCIYPDNKTGIAKRQQIMRDMFP